MTTTHSFAFSRFVPHWCFHAQVSECWQMRDSTRELWFILDIRHIILCLMLNTTGRTFDCFDRRYRSPTRRLDIHHGGVKPWLGNCYFSDEWWCSFSGGKFWSIGFASRVFGCVEHSLHLRLLQAKQWGLLICKYIGLVAGVEMFASMMFSPCSGCCF